MKRFININLALLVGLMMVMTSCNNYLEDINDNPNRPLDVTPDVLLAGAQAFLAYGVGGDMSRYTTLITQQCTGVARQWATYNRYGITETETDNWWRFNHYGGALNDLSILITKSETDGNPVYAGVGKILMAYGLMVATDLVGDIPYTNAFKGTDDLTPTYDSQQDVYNSIVTLLEGAKTDLAGTGPLAPSTDDIIYGGDVDLWTKTANVMLARSYIHLGKQNASNYTAALNALGMEGTDSYGSNAEDCEFNFGTGPTENAPWFQFNDQRGDINHGGFLLNLMLSINDPRLPTMIDTANGNAMGTYFGATNAPFQFAGYVEQKFIEAEAAFQTNALQRAADAHNAAITASLSKLGVSDATFLANEASETSATITLEKIMTHKYIAMFTNVEAFADWRRTGIPALTAVAGNVTSDVIPRRLPYPQSENLYNPNMPGGLTITNRVWWDVP